MQNIDSFLSLLKNVKSQGPDKWHACCPAHNDGQRQGHQSLSIKLAGDKVLLKCFAGCKTPEIVKILGLTMSDLFIGEKQGKPARGAPSRKKKQAVAVYPYYNLANELVYEVVRYEPKSFSQRRPDGKGGYINNLNGIDRVIYRLPQIATAVKRGDIIYHVEGEKDADNLVKLGLEATTSPGGAAAWKPIYAQSYASAALVVIIPDKDERGRAYAKDAAADIHKHARAVKVLELPGEGIRDVSDWLGAGGTAEKLKDIITNTPYWEPLGLDPGAIDYDELRKLLKKASLGQYTIASGAFNRISHTREGDELETPLCNFAARVVEDIFKDNGASISRFVRVQGRLNGFTLPVITIPEAQFDTMKWPRAKWGAKVIAIKGRGNDDHLTNAITFSSGRISERTIYTHTGWREIDGKLTYLTAGGAIGIPEIEVELPSRLSRYNLPQPIGDPREAITKSMDMILIANQAVTIPAFTLPYLSVLNLFEDMSFTAWYIGRSGSMKSVITALSLSHFGRFTHKSLPVNWMGTRTELEKLSFLAKDILFCIDDFAPPADNRDARELYKTAEYMLRAYGNRQGKVRSNSDLTSQETFYPRGLLVTSGEQLPPPGVSRSARILPIPIKIEDFDHDTDFNYDRLTESQKESHLYPMAMAHYIKWIIDNRARVEEEFHNTYKKYQMLAPKKGIHLRLVESISLMQTGYCIATQFACEKGALSEPTRDDMVKEGWDILAELLSRQSSQLTSENPGVRFIEVVRSLLASGRIGLRTRNDAGEWVPSQSPPGQTLVGWDDYPNEEVLLNPDESFASVFNHCQRIGEYFGTRKPEVWQEMKILSYLNGLGPEDSPTKVKSITGNKLRLLPVKRSLIFSKDGVL